MTHFAHLPAVSSALLRDRELLDRVDTKFILRAGELPDLLSRLNTSSYGTVRHEGGAALAYENLYFDTEERALLRAHHRGCRPRFKVRLRHHLSRNISFFEIKQKRPSDVTTKERVPVDFRSQTLGDEASALLSAQPRLKPHILLPAMRIAFRRAMLVGLEAPERVSIDTDLVFSDDSTEASMDELAIIEVKQSRFSARSPIMRALRAQGALQLRISKYVTGGQLIWPDIRLNLYRNRLRMLRRRIA